jgi:hypothetical protein
MERLSLFTRTSLIDSELATHDILSVHLIDDLIEICLIDIDETESFLASCLTISRPEKVSNWSNCFESSSEFLTVDAEWNVSNE